MSGNDATCGRSPVGFRFHTSHFALRISPGLLSRISRSPRFDRPNSGSYAPERSWTTTDHTDYTDKTQSMVNSFSSDSGGLTAWVPCFFIRDIRVIRGAPQLLDLPRITRMGTDKTRGTSRSVMDWIGRLTDRVPRLFIRGIRVIRGDPRPFDLPRIARMGTDKTERRFCP
jgi:hypothetical protein